jgi:hypothetical protein
MTVHNNENHKEAKIAKRGGEHMRELHQGRVMRVDSHGFGFIESTGGSQFTFTFDQIQGYRGQRPRDLGLKEGLVVRFTVHDGLINNVVISDEDHAKPK